MTLLVGIYCKQGAVLAADKQASHGTPGQFTVGQPTTKIKALGDSILFASSGPIGLGQQLCHIVEADQKEIPNRNYHSYATLAQKKFREIVDPAFQTAAHAIRVIGQVAQSDSVCGSLLAARFKDGIKLIEISPQCGVEHLTDTLPFVCLGTGKSNADPFLRYIWSVFFDKRQPNLNEAVLAAYWTVKVGIDLKSFGVGFDVDVFVLDEAEEAWRAIRDRMRGTAGEIAEPPTMRA
jgi:20S proteasome alpha/beta subunit